MVISNIFVLSYALTYGNQLSPASFWLAVRPFFQERSCVSQAKLFLSFCYSCVFIKWKKCNISPSILLIHIVDSTFHQPQAGPPFSPEREMFRKLSFAPTYKTLLSTRRTAVAVCRLSDGSDVRPEACRASSQTKITLNICMLSYEKTDSR